MDGNGGCPAGAADADARGVLTAVKRLEFYKEYYRVTDKDFADFWILTGKDVRYARDKGWRRTSKTERKVMILLQYLALVAAIVCFLLGKANYGLIGCLWFLLSIPVTDFSLLEMELLYRVFCRNTPYAILLHLAFFRKLDSFWQLVMPGAKKRSSGFVRWRDLRFAVTYRVILRKSTQRVFLSIRPNGVKLFTRSHKVIFDDPALPLEALAEQIAEALSALPCAE